MVVDFEEYALEDLGKIITGKTPSTKIPEYFGHGFPFFTPRDMDGKRFITTTERYLTQKGVDSVKSSFLPPESILVSCIGSDMGKVTINKMAGVSNQQINSIILDQEKFNLLYVYYNLSARQKELKNLGASGSALPILNKGDFSKVQIFLPPLATQERIADILGTLDDKIELNRQMNHTLEAMARAIFKSWFVDFDPVYAKMEGRDFPLPAEVLDLFPAEMVESELGLIPKGWEVKCIDDVVETVGGATPSTKDPDYWEEGIHHFATPKDLSNLSFPILTTTERKVTDSGLSKISSGLLDKGTLLMSSRAPVGYLAITDLPVCINQGFIAMKCNRILSNYYMLNWAKYNLDEIKGRASGTTFSEISKKNFRLMEILEPTSEIINFYDGYVKPLYDKITVNIRENKVLVEIKDTLLPKLLGGEIKF